jgi:hypothetical protein
LACWIRSKSATEERGEGAGRKKKHMKRGKRKIAIITGESGQAVACLHLLKASTTQIQVTQSEGKPYKACL